MCRRICVAILLSVGIIPLRAPVRAQPAGGDTITAEQVVSAIDRAVAYLKREQQRDGKWTELISYEGGVTSLCTLALLNSGVPPSDPVIQKALNYLRKIRPRRTYVVGLQTMVLCAAEPNRDRVQIQRNVTWLESEQITQGEMNGAWDYGSGDRQGGDNSNSQFALLALHEAHRIGIKVNPQTWQRAYDYWTRTQNPDGSWGYKPSAGGTGSMTCAGIGALVIASGKADTGDVKVQGGRVQCCGGGEENDALRRALVWLGQHFTVEGNPSNRRVRATWHYYYCTAWNVSAD